MTDEKNKEKQRAVAYIRTSSKDDDGSNQRHKIMEYCERENLELVRIISDIGASGLDTKRRGMQEMLQFLASVKGQVTEVVVTDFSRISRNTDYSIFVAQELLSINVTIRNVAGNHISNIQDIGMMSTTLGLLGDLISKMEQEKPDSHSQRTKEGFRLAKHHGYFPGKAPWGYINTRDDKGKPTLVIDEDKARIIRLVYSKYLSGVPISQISIKGFNKKTLYNILQNVTYAGFVKTDKGNLIKGLHKPIISQEDYLIAQDRLKNEVIKRKQKRL